MLVGIGRAEGSPLFIPPGLHAAAPQEALRSHLEDSRKIGAQRQFQHETDLLARVVGDIEVFVDPLFHRALNRQVNRVRLNIAAFRADLGVREIPTRSIEAELTGIDQHQGLTVEEETIGTDEAAVDSVDARVRWWIGLSGLSRDHEVPSLTYGDP